MLTLKSRKRGFTLAEVLVTIAIIAIMAAVLLPALNNQLSKGDTSRIASDLVNMQSGIQAFVSDLRHYPASADQLITSVSGTSDILGTAYNTSDVASWKGPYVSRDVLSNTGGRASISTTFASLAQSGTATRYLAIRVIGLSLSQLATLESALDEGTDPTTSTTAGVIRFSTTNSSTGAGILNFLAMPIQ